MEQMFYTIQISTTYFLWFGWFEARSWWKRFRPILKEARIIRPMWFQGRPWWCPTVLRPEMGAAGQRFDRLERAHRLGGQGRSLLRDEHRFSGHMPVRGLWQGSGCARMKEKLEARKRFVPLRFLFPWSH